MSKVQDNISHARKHLKAMKYQGPQDQNIEELKKAFEHLLNVLENFEERIARLEAERSS